MFNIRSIFAYREYGSFLKDALVFWILAMSVVGANAAPQLKYVFKVDSTEISVGSRGAACALFPNYFSPGMFTNPNVKPGWDSPDRYGGATALIECTFLYQGHEDTRSAGYAYCGATWQNSSTFVIDKTTESCTCPAGKKVFPENPGVCVAVTEQPASSAPPNDPANNGPGCSANNPEQKQPSCGEPIDPGTGNMWHGERDYSSAKPGSALAIARVYNSSPYSWDASVARMFGTRWTHSYDAVLRAEQPVAAGASPAKCWRREDTLYIWCESPPVVAPTAMPDAVSILRGDGKKSLFSRSGTSWVSRADSNNRLTANYSADGTSVLGWTYVSAQGDVTEQYSANGLLVGVTSRNGVTQRLSYSDGLSNDSAVGRSPADAPACTNVQQGAVLPAGRLMCVTDQWGSQLNFEYDERGRVVKALDPAGQSIAYEYDGPSGGCSVYDPNNRACLAGNLTKVTYPDGKSRTYVYNEAAQINGGVACAGAISVGNGFGNLLNNWTGLIDENGARHISWTYDCLGRATSSQLGTGVEKVKIDYPGGSGRKVTHYLGAPANPQTTTVTYYYSTLLGVSKNDFISAECAECGPVAERLYDANRNITSLKDWSGKRICYGYDLTRNLETVRIEGAAGYDCSQALALATLTLPARKTSTQWHATFNLPVAIATPNKLATYTYDAAGNLLVKTERATTDATGAQGFGATAVGAARTWTYTVNAIGQVQTVTGPRSDVNDTTSYAYDSQSNLSSITNAAGHVTAFSNYDAHGRVGRVTSANGMVTEMGYTVRGLLSWQTATVSGIAETTNYDYDSVGQLTRITLPGGGWINYSYDDAHRLTSVADNLGNSITYTLDLRGNRIKEEIKDPGGALTGQVSRVFDTLNRLQQQTGGVQ